MNPWKFFNRIYYINLDSREDRNTETLGEFHKVHIQEKVRISGTVYSEFEDKHRNACYGNHLSHAKCLRDAKYFGLDNCLIFEDDVEFFDGAFETLTQSIIELPDDWDMFYLGINMDAYYAYRVSDHIAKLDGGFATHAYAIRYTLFDDLIELNENKDILHNDVAYATQIIPSHNCYVSIPLIAGQRDGYSDIMEQRMSSNEMFKQRFRDRLLCGQ